MKNVILWAFVLITVPSGICMVTDVILVLCGDIRPQSGNGIIPDWNNSPIFGYNVSREANILVGMMGVMGIFTGCMMFHIYRMNRKDERIKRNAAQHAFFKQKRQKYLQVMHERIKSEDKCN